MKRLQIVFMFLLISLPAQASTTVTVDDNSTVTVEQTQAVTQPAVTETVVVNETPVLTTQEVMAGDFEGRISQINYSQSWVMVQDANGTERQVSVKPDMINSYRIGDYVLIHPTSSVTLITMEENPKDFEGEIIRVDTAKGQIIVQDTNGRERRVQMKQGMIGTYKVDDYVRIHLMADLKEAKTIETVNVGRLDGSVVRVDPQDSRMVIRDTQGNERTVLVRQGSITTYRVGNQVRVYQLADHEDVQLVRVIG
jgi:hydrogenase maturation factor